MSLTAHLHAALQRPKRCRGALTNNRDPPLWGHACESDKASQFNSDNCSLGFPGFSNFNILFRHASSLPPSPHRRHTQPQRASGMEVVNSLFPLPVRALSRVIYGRDDYWSMHSPSPIMQLSDDELALIFDEVIQANHSLPTPDPLAAMTLSHVCASWRAVALSKSSLWAQIWDLPHPALDQYLFRSGSRPLRVRLQFNPLHDSSVHTALSVIEHTHRCKELHWIDESPHCVINVSAFAYIACFPVLEILELASRTVICCPDKSAPLREAVLYPALRDLTLVQIHPAVFRAGPKPQLRRLALKDVPAAAEFRVSHLLSVLKDCPHLESLELIRATPTIDVHPIDGRQLHPSQSLYPPFVWRPTIPIKNLVFDGAPTTDLWRIFMLLNMPVLETLSHQMPATMFKPEPWPHVFGDDYLYQSADGPIEVPQIHTLNMEYEILDPSKPLAHLAHVTFPNLNELRIAYTHRAWDHDTDPDGEWFERAPFPPPLDHPPLFAQTTFDSLRRLVLTHVSIDLPGMCAVLRDSTRALEHLTLENCVNAGPLVCALGSPSRFDVCLHGHAHPLPPVVGQGRTAEWLGLKVRVLVLCDCADVRIDCLRKTIATRAAAARGVHDVVPGAKWKAWRRKEHEAVRGWTPCRFETVSVEGCAMVTEGGVRMLGSLVDAPEFRFRDGGMDV